jgi:glycosyltransferase involved in cell wall biosynthesis
MRIGINTLGVMAGKSGGDGTYTRYLVQHLVERDRENQYFLFVAPYNVDWFRGSWPNVHLVRCRVPARFTLRVLYEQTVLPILASRLKLDVFHAPVNIAPLLLRVPSVVTVHDSIYGQRDAGIPAPLRLYWGFMRPRSAARASQVICVSQTSRRELLEQGAIPLNRAQIIYNGVDARFCQMDRAACRDRVREVYGLDGPFVLWVGRPYPYKNVPRMVEAFARFNAAEQSQYRLVLVGPSGWQDGALQETIERLGVQGQVMHLGPIANEDLPVLYNASEALLFASLWEACPLPPLEAMACGTPVITSNLSGMPEIVGDAGELVDPLSLEAITGSLRSVLCSPARRHELKARGLVRVRAFTWDENADRTLDLYTQAAGRQVKLS